MNKKQIIDKSIELANQNGLNNLTIASLAKAFNVKSPSLYKHIKNLQEVNDELGIICLDRLINIIQNNCFGLSGDDALKEFCISSRKFALSNPGLYQGMQLTHVKRSKQYQAKAEQLMLMLSKLFSQYNIINENIVHTIRHFRCLLHGFIDLELQNGFGLSDDLDDSFELAINNFIRSLPNLVKRRKT